MKIQLLHLSVDNFKGLDHIGMDFSSKSCTVYGDNATGKTSLYDALLWLLFDKDSHDQKNFEVKPLNQDGEIKDHNAITAVTATLSVNGQPMTFRRELREIWATRRGGSEAFFEGNSSDYFMDGVPLKKGEFARRLSAIIPEGQFRLLTGVSYFCADLPWKDRRQVLFEVCGSVSEREILEQAPQFFALASAAGSISVDDLKRKLIAERKGLAGVRNDIPARLDECQKTIAALRSIDFSALRAEHGNLAATRDKLTADLVAAENSTLLATKVNERDALKNQLTALEGENTRFRAQQATPDATRYQLNQERTLLEDHASALFADLENMRRAAAGYGAEIDRCRSAWQAENARIYRAGACPTCGQPLTGTALQTAASGFEADKKSRLSAIVRESEIIKSKLAHEDASAVTLTAQIATATGRLDEIRATVSALPSTEVAVSDMDGYAAHCATLSSQIANIEGDILRLSSDTHTTCESIRQEIAVLTGRIQTLAEAMAKEGLLTYSQERVSALQAQAADAGAQIEKLDHPLNLIDEFTRHKVRFIEESVNSHFKLARFRLFTEQVNGGLADCCEVTYDGVPFSSLNNGARINVGLDVIETLSRHYGVSVPLFVDNSESVTHLHGIDTQIIRLQVSQADKDLRCETWA